MNVYIRNESLLLYLLQAHAQQFKWSVDSVTEREEYEWVGLNIRR